MMSKHTKKNLFERCASSVFYHITSFNGKKRFFVRVCSHCLEMCHLPSTVLNSPQRNWQKIAWVEPKQQIETQKEKGAIS